MPIRSTIPNPVEKTEALQRLARSGDPSAFLIVFDAQLHETFLALTRAPGEVPADPLKVFIAFSRKMYQEFQGSSERAVVADWYAERRKKYLTRFLDTETESASFEPGNADSFGPVRERLSLALQREYGKQNRVRRSPPTFKTAVGTILGSRWFFIPVIGVVLTLSCLGALQMWWHSAGIGISIAFTNGTGEHRFAFPLSVNSRDILDRLAKKVGIYSHVNTPIPDSIPAVVPVVAADTTDSTAVRDTIVSARALPSAVPLPVTTGSIAPSRPTAIPYTVPVTGSPTKAVAPVAAPAPISTGSAYPLRPAPVPTPVPVPTTTRLNNPVMQPAVKPVAVVPLTAVQAQTVRPDSVQKPNMQSVKPVPGAGAVMRKDSTGGLNR